MLRVLQLQGIRGLPHLRARKRITCAFRPGLAGWVAALGNGRAAFTWLDCLLFPFPVGLHFPETRQFPTQENVA